MPDAVAFRSRQSASGRYRFQPVAIRRPVFGRRQLARAKAPETKPRKPLFTVQDVKEFLMAYCACFMAVMGLIA